MTPPTPIQEPDVLPTRTMLRITLAAIGITLASIGVATLLLGRARHGIGRHWIGSTEEAKHAPRTMGTVEQTLVLDAEPARALYEGERRELDGWSYAPGDRTHARIPIEKAIELYVRDAAKKGATR